MRRSTAVLLAAATAVLTAVPAGAGDEDDPPLVLVDPAGDSRSMPAFHLPVVGPAPVGEDEVPAGDLTGVTGHVEDGRALVVRFEVAGDPREASPLAYGLTATVAGCDISLTGYPQGAPHDGEVVRLFQSGESCPTRPLVPGFTHYDSDARWTVTTSESSVEVRVPFDALSDAQADLLGPGALLQAPAAEVSHYRAAVRASENVYAHSRSAPVDSTAAGDDWAVGQDG